MNAFRNRKTSIAFGQKAVLVFQSNEFCEHLNHTLMAFVGYFDLFFVSFRLIISSSIVILSV